MKKLMILFLILTVCWFLQVAPSYAKYEEGSKPAARLAKTATANVSNRTLVNIGQLGMWIYADGTSANEPNGNAGLYYPRGSSPKTPCIFEDGLIFGGLVQDGIEPALRVGGQAYSSGTQPGAIVSKGVGEDINDDMKVYRIWRVRKDFATVPDEGLRLDASEVFDVNAPDVTADQIAQLRDIYRQDWIDWPAYKGAPYYDAEGDGVYTPQFNGDGTPKLYPDADEPGYAGGDQVVWLICNDLDNALTVGLYGSPPVGVELQETLWAYKRTDGLGNCIFKQFRLIYKGRTETPANARVDSMYFCQWSDPDEGESGDDFAGCDPALGLGYVYNASSSDIVYSAAGYPPPAAGYDFFAGPRVKAAGETAIWGLKQVEGYKNLMMTSFAFFAAGQTDSDPDRGGPYTGTQQWWNLLRGYRPRPVSPPDPWKDPDGNVTMFRVPGDPVGGTGWIDQGAGDRRILLVSGPFTMAYGDTNETVVSTIGGLGSDRLSSVSVLKFYDRFAQAAFDVLFELPSAPPSPSLLASEFDGKILLNWGYDAEGIKKVEGFDDKGYLFEGYNVYQLPNAGAALSAGIKLATYDVANEVTTIVQETFEPVSGQVLALPVQNGKNTGIVRTYIIDNDYFRSKPLANGRTYYFAVTAYSYSSDPEVTTKTLESTPAVVAVVPQTAKPGYRYDTEIGAELAVTHNGPSDGSVKAVVVDNTKLDGHSYKVTFDEVDGQPVWNLTDVTTGKIVLANQVNQSGDDDYVIVNGVKVVVAGPEPGYKNDGYSYYPSGNRFLTPFQDAAGASLLWVMEAFNGGFGWADNFFGTAVKANQIKNIQIRFAAANEDGSPVNPNHPNVSMAYRYLRGVGTTSTPAKPEFAEFIINKGAGYPYQDMRPVCFAAYDMESTPPRRLNVGFQENNTTGGMLDGKWMPARYDIAGGGNNNSREFLYVFASDYSTTPQALYTTNDMINTVANVDLMVVGVASRRGTRLPKDDDYIVLNANHVNSSLDEFTFSSQAPSYSDANAKLDVEKINVFPNPYYGFNTVEKNNFNRFVTFNHLPPSATIRIFSIAGVLVRTIEKNDASQFTTWNLNNEEGLPAASGVYIAYIDMPTLKTTKTIKLAIIREQQFLRIY